MSEVAQGEVDDLNRQAAELRASGDTAGAAGLASAIRDAEVWRDSVKAQADAITVDEAALTAAGLDPTKAPAPEPTEVSDATDTTGDPTLGLDGVDEPAPTSLADQAASGDTDDTAFAGDTDDTAFADSPEPEVQAEPLMSDPTLDDQAMAASEDYSSDFSAGQETPDDSAGSDDDGGGDTVG